MPRYTTGWVDHLYVEGTTTSTTNEIIAAPGASKRIVIASIWLQNAAAGANIYEILSGSTVLFTIDAPTQGDGVLWTLPKDNWVCLGPNEALNLNLDSGTATNYTFQYYVETL